MCIPAEQTVLCLRLMIGVGTTASKESKGGSSIVGMAADACSRMLTEGVWVEAATTAERRAQVSS